MRLPLRLPTTRLRSAIGKFPLLCVGACLLIALVASDASACPTCKDGIAGGDPLSQARAAGYFYSILFMMAMPFVLIGTFGGAAYLSIRRARQRELDAQLQQASGQPASIQ